MKFLSNEQSQHEKMKNQNYQKFMVFIEILQEIFQSHASGIKFTEWNAS